MQSSGDNNFSISGGGADFENRRKSLFDKLNELEVARTGSAQVSKTFSEDVLQAEVTSSRIKRQKRSETRHLQGQESIFKRPEMPPPWRPKNIPDHKKNPHKWTKYSLGDVSQSDMSDRTNTSTALAFLDELRKRNKSSESSEDNDPVGHNSPIRFKKPSSCSSRNTEEEEEEETSVFRGSKRVMPEYVIGKSNKKSNKKDKKSKSSKLDEKQVSLNHLMEDDEDI